MYRENPTNESDSGCIFFSGDETEEYTNNFKKFSIFQFLESEVGTKLVRNSEGAFIEK